MKFRANITKTGPKAKTVELGIVEVGGDDREMVLFDGLSPVAVLRSPRPVTFAANGIMVHGFVRDGQRPNGQPVWSHAEVLLRDAGGGQTDG